MIIPLDRNVIKLEKEVLIMFNYMYSHLYTLASTDEKFKSYTCGSRQSAKRIMYSYMDKKGLYVINKYNDNHFKTYICNDGTKFFINRV